MKYWTLFTVRMLARAGLVTAVIVCVASQFGHMSAHSKFARYTVSAGATSSTTFASMYRDRPDVSAFPTLELPGITVQASLQGYLSFQVEHWLLCFTFLIACVATHWRWKKPDDKESASGMVTE